MNAAEDIGAKDYTMKRLSRTEILVLRGLLCKRIDGNVAGRVERLPEGRRDDTVMSERYKVPLV